MVKIFVGNVQSSTTEPELRVLFEKHGQVSDCDILKNYAFVHMNDEEEAQKAVAELHKYELNGLHITVEFATAKFRNATKVYVGNVPNGTTVFKLTELFQPFGKVVECDVVKNFAFVHMQREKDAHEAISQLNRTILDGKKIVVSMSRPNQVRRDYPPRVPPRGLLPLPPPLPPPPPRTYYERHLYERRDPYSSLRYYERDPYEGLLPPLPMRSLTPTYYYRERSPLASRRSVLPPPSASYAQSGAFNGTNPHSSRQYSLSSSFDKNEYFEESYSNGFVRGY